MKISGVFLFKKKLICLVVEIFLNRMSSNNIVGVSVKIMLSRFFKVKVKLKEAIAFILPKKEMFYLFRGVCNIMVKLAVLWKSKFIRGWGQEGSLALILE